MTVGNMVHVFSAYARLFQVIVTEIASESCSTVELPKSSLKRVFHVICVRVRYRPRMASRSVSDLEVVDARQELLRAKLNNPKVRRSSGYMKCVCFVYSARIRPDGYL